MQVIKPYSDIDATDDPAITQANYPALQWAMRPEYINGAATMLDPISGKTITAASSFTDNGDGTFQYAGGLTQTAMPDVGTKDPVVIFVGSCASSGTIGFGSPVAPPFLISSVADYAFDNAIRIASNSVAIGALTTGRAVTAGVHLSGFNTSGNTGVGICISNDTVGPEPESTIATGSATGTIAGTWGTFDSTLSFTMTNASAIYVFYFTELPEQGLLEASVSWFNANPTRMFPGFIGIA